MIKSRPHPQVVTPYLRLQSFVFLIRFVLSIVCVVVAVWIGRLASVITGCLLLAAFAWLISRFERRAEVDERQLLDSMETLVVEPALRTFCWALFEQAFYLAVLAVLLVLPLGEGTAPVYGCFGGMQLGLALASVRRIADERRREGQQGRRLYFSRTPQGFTFRPRIHFFYVRFQSAASD